MLGAALAVGGTALSAFGSYKAGKEQREARRAQSRLLKQKASMTEEVMGEETILMTERARKMKASQRAIAAKMGAEVGEGTPLMVLAEQAGEMQRDILEQRRTRMREALALRQQARAARKGAQVSGQVGNISAFSTILRGASQLFSSYGGFGGLYATDKADMLSHISSLPKFGG